MFVFGSGMAFRSDIPCMLKFHRFRLLTDKEYRQKLLSKLAEAGRHVEKAFGGQPQDGKGPYLVVGRTIKS